MSLQCLHPIADAIKANRVNYTGVIVMVGAGADVIYNQQIGVLDSGLVGPLTFFTVATIWAPAVYRLLTKLEVRLSQAAGERIHREVLAYTMPPMPPQGNLEFSWVLGEVHHGYVFDYHEYGARLGSKNYIKVGDPDKFTNHEYHNKPNWCVIPFKALTTGVMVLGSTGASKTVGIARPFLRQFFKFARDNRFYKGCGLIGDFKSELVPIVEYEMAKAGRTEDLFIIGPGQPTLWNPVYAPTLSPEAITPRLISAMINISGAEPSDDAKWIFDYGGRLIAGAIGLLRMYKPHSYYTMSCISNLIDAAEVERKKGISLFGEGPDDAMGAVKRFLETLRVNANITADKNDIGVVLPNDSAIIVDDTGHIIQSESPVPQVRAMDNGPLQFNDSRLELENRTWAYYADMVAKIMCLEDKWRTMITSNLEKLFAFFNNPSVSRILCPNREDLLSHGFKGFEWAINEGKVVVMDCHVGLYGSDASGLAMFLKLAFQRAVIDRFKMNQIDPTYNLERPIVFMLDEYQEYVSTSSGEGDDQFYAICRSNKCISIMLTQSPTGLEKRIKSVKTKNLLGSLRTKIIQAQAEPDDREYAAKVAGEVWRNLQQTKTIAGSLQNAEVSGSGDFLGEKATVSESITVTRQKGYRFEPTFFAEIPTLTALVISYDGNDPLPPTTVKLKASFEENWDVTHLEVVHEMRKRARQMAQQYESEEETASRLDGELQNRTRKAISPTLSDEEQLIAEMAANMEVYHA